MTDDRLPARPATAPAPSRVGQATAVEQARAMTQVYAQVSTAQQSPRDIGAASNEMSLSCATKSVAERAFFRYNRGDGTVSGITIQLARELARCFRNMDYGIAELHRDDDEGMSEMIAFAWDLEANTRCSTTFFVPHRRYIGGQDLTDLRDVYENNASQGGRRVREMIIAVLPPWFVEDAKAQCHATLEKGDGKPIEDRRESAIGVYEGIGVTQAMLEQKLGRTSANWGPTDLAHLSVVLRSIKRHEVNIEDEFPKALVTAADLAAQSVTETPESAPSEPAPAPVPDEPAPTPDEPPAPDTPPVSAPEPITEDELKDRLKKAKLSQSKTIKAAAEMDYEARSMAEIVADPECLADILDWITVEVAKTANK